MSPYANLMSQATIEYNKPYIEKVNNIAVGILSEIIKYEFTRHSESVPGSSTDRTNVATTFLIKTKTSTEDLERKVKFNGFIGNELIGNEVQFDDRIAEKTTYFDPEGMESYPWFRRGKKEIERVQRVIPVNKSLPTYISRETSQFSL